MVQYNEQTLNKPRPNRLSLNLKIQSMDWFLYDNGFRNERVKYFK